MRHILLFCIAIVILGIFIGVGLYKDKYMAKDEVKIIIYKQGKEIPIDPSTPHFKELQEKCEDFLSSADDVFRDYVSEEDVVAVKKNELAIEVVYKRPKEIGIPFFTKKEKADHLLIPLTGKYVSTEKKLRTPIFFYGPGYGPDYMGPYEASKSVAEIINLLKSMGIEID